MAEAKKQITNGYIGPVPIEELRQAVSQGRPDSGSEALRLVEEDYIRHWREARGDGTQEGKTENLCGLALSGGGIRSATFSLGVLQALARSGLLKKMDYISTVSGGGYIGSAVTWLLSRESRKKLQECRSDEEREESFPDFDLDEKGFPFGADDPAPDAERTASDAQQRMLRYLRSHGYYLSPGKGITLVSLVSVVLRGIILNLLVWLPLLVLFFSFGGWLFAHLKVTEPVLLGWLLDNVVTETLRAQHTYIVTGRVAHLFGFEVFLWITVTVAMLLLGGGVVYSVLTWFRRGVSRRAACNWYLARRKAEQASAVLIPVAVLTLVMGVMPVIAVYLQGWLQTTGPVAILIGMLMAIRYFLTSTTSNISIPPGLAVTVGSALFLFGIMLVAFQAAFFWIPPWDASVEASILLILAALGFGTGWFVDLNYLSIHRYYRDRLMESYMPDISKALQNITGVALGADGANLHKFGSDKKPRSPYHILNTNVVLVNSEESTYSNRGGDNFILSPLFCGSNATGWRRTAEFMQDRMTLPTAVAVSAAAVNPNTGVGGEGLTRNLFLSLVMYLLNLRIGYWATHPNPEISKLNSINHLLPGSYALGSVMGMPGTFGFNENRPYLQLTDGGHFENMAVYELARRRVRLILVVDGGADPKFSFSDFQTTVRRVEDDFGACFHAIEGANPDNIVPVAPEKDAYPMETKFAKQGHMLGTLTYSDGSKATVIYLKTVLVRDVSFKVKGYAAQHPDFPDQSTADQFFDEVQFESYRELGFRLADGMLNDKVPDAFDSGVKGRTYKELIREACCS